MTENVSEGYPAAVSKVVGATEEFMLYADLGPAYEAYDTRLQALRAAIKELEKFSH